MKQDFYSKENLASKFLVIVYVYSIVFCNCAVRNKSLYFKLDQAASPQAHGVL